MKLYSKTVVLLAVVVLVLSSCKSAKTLTAPVPATGVSISLMASYPAGNMPTIRNDSNGYIISYYYYGDMWLMKADASGDCVWARNYYRGAAFLDYVDQPYGVAAASDGYYVTGDSHPFGGVSNNDYHDFIAIKTDLSGNEIWRHTIDDKGRFGSDVTADNDGGVFTYIGGGQSMIIKYKGDASGDTVWSYTAPMVNYTMPSLLWTGSGFFYSNTNGTGAFTDMISAAGTGAGAMNYTLPGTFGQTGPYDSPSCAVPGGGFLTARSYKAVSTTTTNDVILLSSNAAGTITASHIYGRTADDEFVAGVATDGKWILIPCNINAASAVPYIILLDSAGNFVKEIILSGMVEVDSIIAGKNSGEFVIAGNDTSWTNMVIKKITVN